MIVSTRQQEGETLDLTTEVSLKKSSGLLSASGTGSCLCMPGRTQ
jgi:hypothetical protein